MTRKQRFNLCVCSCAEDGGLVQLSLDAVSGEISELGKHSLDRPMYAIARKNRLFVLTREGGAGNFGSLCGFSLNERGGIAENGEKLDTGGVVPCHLDEKDGEIYAVNYLSGNVRHMGGKTVFHEGKGPHPTRQTVAHTHCVRIARDGNVLVTDLGLDTVFVYSEELEFISSAKVPSGYGARHILFSRDGKLLYCVNELVSSVSIFRYADGLLTLLNTYPAAPDMAENTAAAIRIDEGKLYVSNRGHDSVAVFEICGEELKFEKYISSYGKEPRDFDIFGKFIVCTNQKSGNVTVIDKHAGELVSEISVKEALCVTEI